MREAAVPALEATAAGATGPVKLRLERTLAAMTGWQQAALTPLARLRCDDLIERFVLVGDLLERDDPMSWEQLSNGLKAANPKFLRPRSGASPRNLDLGMAELARRLHLGPLTDHGGSKRGRLTAEGRRWLTEARKHLADVERQG